MFGVGKEEEAEEPHVYAIGVLERNEICDFNGHNIKTLTYFWMIVMWLRGELVILNLRGFITTNFPDKICYKIF